MDTFGYKNSRYCYIRFQGIEYITYLNGPTYGKNCLRIAADIISGRLLYTDPLVDELMLAADVIL